MNSTAPSVRFQDDDNNVTATTSTTTTTLRHNMPHSESVTGVADLDQQQQQDHSVVAAAVVQHPNNATLTKASSSSSTLPDNPFASTNTLVCPGTTVLFATDEWFATADRLFDPSPPSFDPDAYCEQGKVMDGWETRRRREEGHDWMLAALPERCVVRGIQVDTAYFTGNNAPAISIDGVDADGNVVQALATHVPGVVERLLLRNGRGIQGTGMSPTQVAAAADACRDWKWQELLPQTPLQPGYEESRWHFFKATETATPITHIRINYFPDGGVARIRLWGDIVPANQTPDPPYCPIVTGRRCTVLHHKDGVHQLASQQPFSYPEISLQDNGGMGLACSNKHYGDPWNLIQRNLGVDMGDGWETARHPERPGILVKDPKTNLVDSPLMDWCILKLGNAASDGIERIILCTKHFRGNYPESVQVEGCWTEFYDSVLEETDTDRWFPLIPRCRMAPDAEHVFDRHQLEHSKRPVSHVRVSVYPDGGISRVRVYAKPGHVQ